MPTSPPAAPQAPIFQISLANATLISVVYLLAAAGTDVARRLFTWRWTETLSEAFEEFPARTLRWFGLFGPLRNAYLEGSVGALGVRLLLGLTMVGLVYCLAMGVGALMWLGRWGYQKAMPPAAPKGD